MVKEVFDEIYQTMKDNNVVPYEFIFQYELKGALGNKFDEFMASEGVELLYLAYLDSELGVQDFVAPIYANNEAFIKFVKAGFDEEEYSNIIDEYVENGYTPNILQSYINNNFKKVKASSLRENDAWNYDFALYDVRNDEYYKDANGDMVFFDGSEEDAETYFKNYCEFQPLCYVEDTE